MIGKKIAFLESQLKEWKARANNEESNYTMKYTKNDLIVARYEGQIEVLKSLDFKEIEDNTKLLLDMVKDLLEKENNLF